MAQGKILNLSEAQFSPLSNNNNGIWLSEFVYTPRLEHNKWSINHIFVVMKVMIMKASGNLF